ncbi:MAG: hypothetical protein U9Q80_04810, partial [Bacillota bacterium]|nr:hypothetical protein [Bacillota bacterium]
LREMHHSRVQNVPKNIQIILGAFLNRLRKAMCVIWSINKLCREGFDQLHYLKIFPFMDCCRL